MSSLENDSMVGRLLEEISWDGKSVKRYRNGGRGLENVLTAEVFMMLDFLPRDEFLGAVLRKAHGAASTAAFAADEASSAITSLLPGDAQLTPTTIVLQPDAWIETTSCRILVEAKRIRSSAFQQEQLAREYLALMQHTGYRRNLLLLVLGSPPPIKVKGVAGHIEPAESIALRGLS